MSAIVQKKLNNTNNDVIIKITAHDNYMAIYLNPDELSVGNSEVPMYGFIKVYEGLEQAIGVQPNVTINISNYLHAFKTSNPKVTAVELVFCMSNFAGPGPYAYEIEHAGGTAAGTGNLPSWSSSMDSYIVNIF